jgi:hypothetical protein
MAVNFGLLQPAQPVSAFFQGQQDVRAEADRNMLRQQQAEKLQMERENMLAQRGEREALAADRRAKTAAAAQRQQFLTGLGAKMAEGGYKLDRPTLGQMLQFGMQTGEDSLIKLATEGMRALDEEDLYTREAERFGLGGAAAPAAGAPANALAAPAGVTRDTVQNMLTSPSARIREQGKALAQTLPAAPATPADVATMKALGFPLTAAGYAQFRDAQRQERLKTPQEEAQEIRIARESRPLPQPREPNKPFEVVDPNDPTKIITVSAEEAIAKRMTPAKAIEGLSPKEIQKREAAHPQATSSIKNFTAKSEQFIKELEKLRDDPGLDSITGTIYGVTPGVVSGAAGRRAMAAYNKIFAKGGFQALQDLKAASATGGALGNVSNEEGRRLEASTVGGIDRSQSLKDVQDGINAFITEIRGSMQRVREAYDDTYEYRTSRGRAGAAPSAPAGLSPEDKQALDWANSNPKDPRAAQIKQRLGM